MDGIRELFGTELGYIVLLFTLFVVPRFVQRWRIPAAVTSLGLGALSGPGLHLFEHDQTVHLLATFGIVALFLFAGLEVSASDLRRERRTLVQYLLQQLVLIGVGTWASAQFLGLDVREAALVSLALLTPSTGFILDSLDRLPLTEPERFWIKSKAVSAELLALLLLFFTLQSGSLQRLALSSLALLVLVALLPVVFRWFAMTIEPHAPKSEFAFLLMLALLCAFVTRRLGAYYLVGAFVVGVAGRRFRDQLPAMGSDQMLHAVEVFAQFFVPFYFFTAGLELRREDFSVHSLVLGIVLTLLAVPLRLLFTLGVRRLAMGESPPQAMRVAVPLAPTLVFTLVLAGILRDQFLIDPGVFGGLIVYTLLNTLVPAVVFGLPLPWTDLRADTPWSPAPAATSGAGERSP